MILLNKGGVYMVMEGYTRVPVTMTYDMVDWMEQLSLQAKRTGGIKIANTAIVRACLGAIMEIGVDATAIKSEEDLKERILQRMGRRDKEAISEMEPKANESINKKWWKRF